MLPDNDIVDHITRNMSKLLMRNLLFIYKKLLNEGK